MVDRVELAVVGQAGLVVVVLAGFGFREGPGETVRVRVLWTLIILLRLLDLVGLVGLRRVALLRRLFWRRRLP